MKLTPFILMLLLVFPLNTQALENSKSDAKYVDGRAVASFFVSERKAIHQCYLDASKGTAEVPSASQEMVLDFTIEPDGKLQYMKLDPTRSIYKNEEVANCIAQRAARWIFPKLISQKPQRYFQGLRFDQRY